MYINNFMSSNSIRNDLRALKRTLRSAQQQVNYILTNPTYKDAWFDINTMLTTDKVNGIPGQIPSMTSSMTSTVPWWLNSNAPTSAALFNSTTRTAMYTLTSALGIGIEAIEKSGLKIEE